MRKSQEITYNLGFCQHFIQQPQHHVEEVDVEAIFGVVFLHLLHFTPFLIAQDVGQHPIQSLVRALFLDHQFDDLGQLLVVSLLPSVERFNLFFEACFLFFAHFKVAVSPANLIIRFFIDWVFLVDFLGMDSEKWPQWGVLLHQIALDTIETFLELHDLWANDPWVHRQIQNHLSVCVVL